MTILLYLGKVLVCSAILMGYYWLFLRNKRFHHYNRFYLQATLLLSVILPFIKIRVGFESETPVNQAVYQTLDVLTVGYGEGDEPVTGASLINSVFTMENILYLVYAAGVLVLLWTLVRSILYIKRISKRYPYEHINQLKFYSTQEPGTPFSFFRSIFWNNEMPFNSLEGQQIFRHELFHVQQKHSHDIILTEIVTAFFWYNPFFHLLKKELKAIHEFLADEYAISGNDRYAYAELLVIQTLKARNIPVTNYFFQNHIKRRIAMITNLTASKYGYFSRLMVLPVSALLFCIVTVYAQPKAQVPAAQLTSTTKNKPITVVIDAGHGGSDNGAVSTDGSLKEKDFALQISLKLQQLAPAYNVNVIMTRTNNDLPGNSTTPIDGIRARTVIAEQNKADAFISIHMSSVTPDIAAEDKKSVADYNGIEVFITRENEKWLEPSKALGSSVLQTLSSWYTTYPTLKQRKQKGIWVLDHSPCPAILIECGFITNDKDVAYFKDENNQEKLAKKILEGLANYNNNKSTTAVPNTSPTTASRAAMPQQKPMEQPVAKTAVAAQPPIQPVQAPGEDSLVLQKITRYYCRNARYPEQALKNNVEGTVYFSIMIDEKGRANDLMLHNQLPSDAGKVSNITTGSLRNIDANTNVALSENEKTKLLQEQVKQVFEKQPTVPGVSLDKPSRYYFKVDFKLDTRKQTPSTT